MEIRFNSAHYKAPENTPLKLRLEPFFNRADVQAMLERAAKHVFPNGLNGKKNSAYPLSSFGLTEFAGAGVGDGDPYNYSAMLLDAAKVMKDDKAADVSLRTGMESLAKQLVTLVELEPAACELKASITNSAKANGFTGIQRG